MSADDDSEARHAKVLQRVEETRVGKEILEVLRNRLEKSTTLKNTLSSPEFKGGDYAEERKVLVSINNFGLMEGALAGIATFLVLRRGPQLMLRLLNSRASRGGGGGGGTGGAGYQLDRPPTVRGGNPFDKNSQQRSGGGVGTAVLGGMKLALDLFVAFLMGASTSFQVIDEEKLVNTVANLPLAEGRSIVSDEFCSTLQQEVVKRNPAVFTQADSAYLRGMYLFHQNCRKRQSYEATLREESGMSPNDPVSIPEGGVPSDYIMRDGDVSNGNDDEEASYDNKSSSTTDESYFSDADFGSDNIFGDDSTSEAEKEWADSIVTDRENDRKRK